jgi:hypothetical protein
LRTPIRGSVIALPPKATIRGMERVELVVNLHFDQDLKKNGSIAAIEVKTTN